MASGINKIHRKQCKKMTEQQLKDTIRLEEPRVKVLSSLVECAKYELKRRNREKPKEE